MSYKPNEIIKRAKSMKKNGVVYGYGYKYEKVTSSNIASRGKMYAYTSEQKALMKKKIGKIAIDCSGFVNRAAGTNLGGSSMIKSSSPATYPVSDKEHRMSGMFIWRNGHIGLIYCEFGKWYIIEAASTASDLIITEWSKRASAFTCYGKIKGVSYKGEKKSYKDYSESDFVKDMRKALDLPSSASRQDILKQTVKISINKNRYNSCIDCVEKRLTALKYYTGKIESDEYRSPIYGNEIMKAVKKYEKKEVFPKNPDKANGILEAKGATWKKLLGL